MLVKGSSDFLGIELSMVLSVSAQAGAKFQAEADENGSSVTRSRMGAGVNPP